MVATDYTEEATPAVEYAVALANKFGSLLTLCSAVDEPYSAAAGALVDIDEHIRDEAMKTMEKVKTQIEPALANGATIDIHTVDGDPGRTLPKVAQKHNYDLIVIGTKGSTAAREMFTGSVANGLIKHSRLPVLVVPNTTRFQPPHRVLYAADDHSLAGPEVLRPLTEVARVFPDAEVVVYHSDADGDADSYDPRLSEYLADVPHRFEVQGGDADSVHEDIQRAVKLYGSDLLVMIYHNRGFFGGLFNQSTVSKVTFEATVPILVLPDNVAN